MQAGLTAAAAFANAAAEAGLKWSRQNGLTNNTCLCSVIAAAKTTLPRDFNRGASGSDARLLP